MDAASALASLTALAAAASDPVLDAATLADIVARSRRADAGGRLVSDTGWVPTFDLDWAVMTAWETKAGLAAGRFDFDADGAKASRSQITKACLAMADRYRGRLSYTVDMPEAPQDPAVTGGWWV